MNTDTKNELSKDTSMVYAKWYIKMIKVNDDMKTNKCVINTSTAIAYLVLKSL